MTFFIGRNESLGYNESSAAEKYATARTADGLDGILGLTTRRLPQRQRVRDEITVGGCRSSRILDYMKMGAI